MVQQMSRFSPGTRVTTIHRIIPTLTLDAQGAYCFHLEFGFPRPTLAVAGAITSGVGCMEAKLPLVCVCGGGRMASVRA